MPVHMQTGNGIDVVYDWEGDRKVFKGLWLHEWRGVRQGMMVDVCDPRSLAEGILRIVGEVEEHNQRLTDTVAPTTTQRLK